MHALTEEDKAWLERVKTRIDGEKQRMGTWFDSHECTGQDTRTLADMLKILEKIGLIGDSACP